MAYVGKLIVSKGVDLLLAAWPLVVDRLPDARLCVVGFGTYRDALGELVDALGRGRPRRRARDRRRGRELEGGPPGELTYLAAFLDGLDGERPRRLPGRCARRGRARGVHRPPRARRPARCCCPRASRRWCPAPSPRRSAWWPRRQPAAAPCRCRPSHSGLAEVTATLAEAVEPEIRPLLSFERGPGAVEEIAARLIGWLTLPAAQRERHGRLVVGRGPPDLRLGERGRGRDRGCPGAPGRASRSLARQSGLPGGGAGSVPRP